MTNIGPPMAGPAADPAVARISRSKGVLVADLVAAFADHHGWAHVAATPALLPEDHRAAVLADRPDLGFLATGWYPDDLIHAILNQLLRALLPAEHAEMAQRCAARVTQNTLHGVYRGVAGQLNSPARLAARGQILWDKFHDSGNVDLEAKGADGMLMLVSAWKGHHPFLCRLHAGVFAAVLEDASGHPVAVRPLSCVASGMPTCSFRLNAVKP